MYQHQLWDNISIDINKFNSIERNLALGNDYSFFDSKGDMTYGIINNEDFKHNNMVPHFSKKQMINDYNEQTFAHRMELFSGSSKNFTPKKESLQENFTPLEKDVNLVNGSQNNIELLQGYYLPSTQKRNVLPFEQQQIGPGLNLDPSQTSRPDGGSFEEYRPMPKTIDELRSDDNPKITFAEDIDFYIRCFQNFNLAYSYQIYHMQRKMVHKSISNSKTDNLNYPLLDKYLGVSDELNRFINFYNYCFCRRKKNEGSKKSMIYYRNKIRFRWIGFLKTIVLFLPEFLYTTLL